jgi:hypothetical protein
LGISPRTLCFQLLVSTAFKISSTADAIKDTPCLQGDAHALTPEVSEFHASCARATQEKKKAGLAPGLDESKN